MRIAVIGGGASGLITAYLLDRKGHHVTVFEKQPILGGHIRTVNKNVKLAQVPPDLHLECGVLEFPLKFHNFLNLMQELNVALEPVDVGSALFLKNGRHILSGSTIRKNFKGLQRLIESLKLDTLYARSMRLQIKTHIAQLSELHNQPLSRYLNNPLLTACWGKLLTMYSYSTAFDRVDQFPAELAIPTLREYVFTGWVRVKTGVYSYIEKILERFKGDIRLNAQIATVRRGTTINIELLEGTYYQFDQVVFATPPDQVIPVLADPTDAEIRRFSGWHKNQVTTVLHTDGSMYDRHQIHHFSEFDFFQTETGWGYNAYLNQLCGIQSSVPYSLAFQLDDLIHPDKIIHRQDHETPLYTVESFRYRDELVATNGTNNTYYVGAYLGDGLHEGAVTSALRVAQLMG
jgi:uncharacterized protein